MKNWEIIDGEYTRKVMWINHEIEMRLYCNGEDDIDEDEIDETKVEEMVEKILENKEYWDKKCKNIFAFMKFLGYNTSRVKSILQ